MVVLGCLCVDNRRNPWASVLLRAVSGACALHACSWQPDNACQALQCNMFTIDGLAIKIWGYFTDSIFSCQSKETSTPPIRHPRSGKFAPPAKKIQKRVHFLGRPAVSKSVPHQGPFMPPPCYKHIARHRKESHFQDRFRGRGTTPKNKSRHVCF